MDEITPTVCLPGAKRDRLLAKREASPALLNNQFEAEKKKERKDDDNRSSTEKLVGELCYAV
eukprot:11375132-Ditylum_brightwellii.AAC.1